MTASTDGDEAASKQYPTNRDGTRRKSRVLQRKTDHSLIERRRREKINEKLIQLQSVIPACRLECQDMFDKRFESIPSPRAQSAPKRKAAAEAKVEKAKQEMIAKIQTTMVLEKLCIISHTVDYVLELQQEVERLRTLCQCPPSVIGRAVSPSAVEKKLGENLENHYRNSHPNTEEEFQLETHRTTQQPFAEPTAAVTHVHKECQHAKKKRRLHWGSDSIRSALIKPTQDVAGIEGQVGNPHIDSCCDEICAIIEQYESECIECRTGVVTPSPSPTPEEPMDSDMEDEAVSSSENVDVEDLDAHKGSPRNVSNRLTALSSTELKDSDSSCRTANGEEEPRFTDLIRENHRHVCSHLPHSCCRHSCQHGQDDCHNNSQSMHRSDSTLSSSSTSSSSSSSTTLPSSLAENKNNSIHNRPLPNPSQLFPHLSHTHLKHDHACQHTTRYANNHEYQRHHHHHHHYRSLHDVYGQMQRSLPPQSGFRPRPLSLYSSIRPSQQDGETRL